MNEHFNKASYSGPVETFTEYIFRNNFFCKSEKHTFNKKHFKSDINHVSLYSYNQGAFYSFKKIDFPDILIFVLLSIIHFSVLTPVKQAREGIVRVNNIIWKHHIENHIETSYQGNVSKCRFFYLANFERIR